MKTVRLGIFGLGRGANSINECIMNNGEVVALCERDIDKMNYLKNHVPAIADAACYTDFDEFIEHDMDAVLLANCFHEHAPYAIKALERGIHVLCECTSNITMAEGVALVRAAEKSDAFYMLAENYPFFVTNQEMRRVYRSGKLGKALFCEGEYNHPVNFNDTTTHKHLRPYPEHWRNYLPRTYYITHSLAPLMFITGAFPKRVTAMPVYAPLDEYDYNGSFVGDRAAIITTLNDDDSVYRVTGCAGFGAHENSYRVCAVKGQMENLRGMSGKIMLRYNEWETPEGEESQQFYEADWPEDIRELARSAGHGGGDFCVMREFLNCIREGRRPEFDEYFATTCASVAILGHRSLLEYGTPYDIPDFRKEEDRVKWENDDVTPFPNTGRPTVPVCSDPDYRPGEEQYRNYLKLVGREE